MDIRTSTETNIRLSESDVKECIAEVLTKKLGKTVRPSNITFDIYGGDPGGYGSMGDPAHVYNPPTPASFGGAKIRIIE